MGNGFCPSLGALVAGFCALAAVKATASATPTAKQAKIGIRRKWIIRFIAHSLDELSPQKFSPSSTEVAFKVQQTVLLARPNICTLKGRGRLRAYNTGIRTALRGKSTVLTVVAILCVALLGVLAAVQVAHFHSNETLADHCPLCVSLHSAAPVAAVVAAAILLVQIGRSTPVLEQQFVPRRRNSKLYTRPPPAGF
jgi:ABC-type phosphate transport system permease subunit